MDIKQPLENYIFELSSSSPTPGGGNVSALCGALATSLGTMVCNLTIGKKKYSDVQNEFIELKPKFETYTKKFIELANLDNKAFDKVMEAYTFPQNNEDDKIKRSHAIEEATKGAAEIPGKVIETVFELLGSLKTIADKGNQNSISDVGVAALLCKTAAQGAYLNVLINCSALKNREYAEKFIDPISKLVDLVSINSDDISNTIFSRIKYN